MKFSSNSTVPTYAIVVPYVPPSLPISPSSMQGQYPSQVLDQQTKPADNSPIISHRSVLTFLGGLFIIILLTASVAVPLIVLSSVFSNELSTRSITSTSTTPISLRWNATGISVAGAANYAGVASDHLNFPIGIVLDSSDTLYIADSNNNRVQNFLLGSINGTTVAGNLNGVSGSNATLLYYPNDIAVDSNGNIYIVDTTNHRIQLWSVKTSSGITIAGNGTAGGSLALLNGPRAIALDSNPNVFYISDGNNARVMRYTLNSTIGTVVAGGTGAGTSNTQLSLPRGLYFDSTTNSLVIANPGANNVVRWMIGASNWTLVAGNINGSAGSGPNELNNPWDVTLDPMGNVYVADRFNQRIQFFAAGQMNGTTIAGVTGQSGTTSMYLNQPLSVALDSQLNVYVADASNSRVQKFVRY